MEERPQKPDLIFRSSSIETSTPRLQPDQRRQPSFSSPTYSPTVSPSYSDHSTSCGFYSPRGGEDEDEVVEDDDSDCLNCNYVEEDERGYLYRPRSPAAVEMPVISTVSRSVRVEPKVVTRVDSGVNERDFVERRIVEEDGGVEFRGGGGGGRVSVRRKWDGRNTVVYNSGLKEKEVVRGLRVVEEDSSDEFRVRKLFEIGANEKQVVEEERLDLGRQRGRSNAFVSDFDVKEELRVLENGNGELGNRRGQKSNRFVSEPGVNEKEVVVAHRVAEEANVEFTDGNGQNLNAFVSDFSVNEKEVARGQRVLKEKMVRFRDGRSVGIKSEARNAMVVDSSPKLVYDSRQKNEVEGTKAVVHETRRKDEEGFNGPSAMVVDSSPKLVYDSRQKNEVEGTKAVVRETRRKDEEGFNGPSAMEEGGGRGGEGKDVEGLKPTFKRRQEGSNSEVLFMRKAALWLRIFGLTMCMISFSIMAKNKNNGWALDSFDRYKEFRYCMAVSILGFVYSLAQAFDLAYRLSIAKYSNEHGQLRYYVDFFMDQALSYLLISASSSAATRVEDWISNWGKDKFPQMSSISVIISFLAFGSFAFSSLVSGYILCSFNVS